MWDRVRKQTAVEREQLNHLIETHRPLLEKCANVPPDAIELSALAAMLHSFYTGVENIFKRVVIEIDGAPPQGGSWHRELLDRVTHLSAARPAVISTSLRETLRGYLDFRHVFRNAYSFQLQWEKMASLVLECEETLQKLEAELDVFFESADSEQNS